MKKDTPILIIGMGSIGVRRYESLTALGYTCISVYDSDHKKTRKYQSVPKLTEKTCRDFTVFIIASPTTEHIRVAQLGARVGAALFIEKPLSHDTSSIAPLLTLTKTKGTYATVACNFRFHKGFLTLNSLLKKKTFGTPLTASVIFTRDITRNGTDKNYTTSYAAQKKGGGVIFDLGPHIFEYLDTLFGTITQVIAETATPAGLGIQAEELVEGVLEHASGVRSVFQLDYFSKPKRHEISVCCKKGTYILDLANNTLTSETEKKTKTVRFPSNEREDMYVREMEYFMKNIEKKEPAYSLSRGRGVVAVCEAVRRASQTGTKQSVPANKYK